MPPVKAKKVPRYTPVSKRQDKPDAVYWILRNHPEFTDADIVKLIGTTKATIQKIRERSHWNATNIKAVDPVTLGLCSQIELDLAVERASHRRERLVKKTEKKRRDAEADRRDGRCGRNAAERRRRRVLKTAYAASERPASSSWLRGSSSSALAEPCCGMATKCSRSLPAGGASTKCATA